MQQCSQTRNNRIGIWPRKCWSQHDYEWQLYDNSGQLTMAHHLFVTPQRALNCSGRNCYRSDDTSALYKCKPGEQPEVGSASQQRTVGYGHRGNVCCQGHKPDSAVEGQQHRDLLQVKWTKGMDMALIIMSKVLMHILLLTLGAFRLCRLQKQDRLSTLFISFFLL